MNLYHIITYYILIAISSVLRILSIKKHYIISHNIASILYNYIPKRKITALENLQIAFPNKSKEWRENTLRSCYQFFVYNFIQFMSFPIESNSINIEVAGKQFLENAMQKKKGVILISAHFGAWEILGYWFGVNNYPLNGVAQKQKNKGANKFFEITRQLSGVKQIYRKTSMDSFYDVLKNEKILGLVSDQDAKNKGVFVDFFDYPASTHKGASLFHLNTNAPMIFGICVQKGFVDYRVEFMPVQSDKKSIESITQLYTSIIEKTVKKYPEQYFWFHKRWKTKK